MFWFHRKNLGAVHKRHPQSGWLSSADIMRTRGKGSSDADVCTFWCKKLRVFQNLWCVRTDKDRERDGRSIFRDFVRASFMNGPLCSVYTYRFDNQVPKGKLQKKYFLFVKLTQYFVCKMDRKLASYCKQEIVILKLGKLFSQTSGFMMNGRVKMVLWI